MKIFSEKSQVLGWISIILVAGFLTTNIVGYAVYRDSIRHSIAEQALPLTGDNIYSEIQKDILRPVFISSLMAQDTFLRDWILGNERDASQIERYLKEVKQKYGTITSFLVSDRTRKYYHADGVLKSVQESEPRDKWYFRVRKMTAPYETNVDFDLANRDTMTIFINYRVMDYHGNFIGATGVGLTLDTVSHIIDSYQQRFQRRVYFVDEQGQIVLAGKSMAHIRGSIRDQPGIREIAGAILNRSNTQTQLEYRLDKSIAMVNSRFIPELGWYLVVEQNDSEDLKSVKQVFILNLVISAAVTLMVLVITLFAVNRYQVRIERMASTDSLTGLLNRQAFEMLFQQLIKEAKRSGRPLSVILFDIDLFKRVNDTYGHLVGDQVIREIARLARSENRESDVTARWGGEEFMILLKDCPLEQAVHMAEKLRLVVASHDFALTPPSTPITLSLGVAQYTPGESEPDFFARTDKALYQAKANGRNLTES